MHRDWLSKGQSLVTSGARGSLRLSDPNGQLIFVRGQGPFLWDDQQRRYLDCVSGFSSTLFGHGHPRLIQAAVDQMARLTQLVGWQHPWRIELEAKLAKIAPIAGTAKVWLASTGARAVEVAWKVAYAYRPGSIVTFDIAYHGRSLATAELSQTARLPIVECPTLPPLPFPRCQSCPCQRSPNDCQAECFDASETWLEVHAPQISSIIVEPAIGARGYYYAPPVFFHRLRSIADRLGLILIDDEIQMGLGRLGSMFAAERQGWQPDLIVLGKSLGGGIVPISAVVGRAEIMDALDPGYESETFAANPLACCIAVEAIQLIKDEKLIEHALKLEKRLAAGLANLQRRAATSLNVDCLGASGFIEIPSSNAHPMAGDPPDQLVERWAIQAREKGLLVHWSGVRQDRLVLIPPLVATELDLQSALDLLAEIVSGSSTR